MGGRGIRKPQPRGAADRQSCAYRAGEFARGLIAVTGVFGHCGGDDAVECRRQPGHVVAEPGRGVLDVSHHHRIQSGSVAEWGMTGEQVEQCAPQGVDVGARVERPALQEFRGGIGHRRDHVAGAGQPIVAGRNIYPTDIERAACRVSGVRPGCSVAVRLDAGQSRETFAVAVESTEYGDPAQVRRIERQVAHEVFAEADVRPRNVVVLQPGRSRKPRRASCGAPTRWASSTEWASSGRFYFQSIALGTGG